MSNPDRAEGLAQSVRGRLDEGAAPEDIVRELVARGMSSSTAEIFVERVRSTAPAPSRSRAFPARTVIAVLGAVLIVAVAVPIALRLREDARRRQQARAAAAAELAAADRARAEQIRAESRADLAAAAEASAEQRSRQLAVTSRQLESDRPMTFCDATTEAWRRGYQEAIPRLRTVLSTSTANSLRICAASALAHLGDRDTAMATYTEWAGSQDNDLERAAIMGFGEVGPTAAAVALPHLADVLKSPHMDMRYLATDALARLGPEAKPLLEIAAGDVDKDVRQRAAAALAALKP